MALTRFCPGTPPCSIRTRRTSAGSSKRWHLVRSLKRSPAGTTSPGWVTTMRRGCSAQRVRQTLTLTEDDIGLRYEVPLDMSDPDAQRMAAKVRAGKMPGSSFSFTAIEQEWSETDVGFPLRRLLKVRLHDVGPATFPAYPDTAGDGVAVALRSLAAHTGTEFDALRAAHAAGDVRTAIKSSDTTEATELPTSRLAVARARLALAELGSTAV